MLFFWWDKTKLIYFLFPRCVFKDSGLSSGPSLGPASSGLNNQYQPQPVGEGEHILEFLHNQTRNVFLKTPSFDNVQVKYIMIIAVCNWYWKLMAVKDKFLIDAKKGFFFSD